MEHKTFVIYVVSLNSPSNDIKNNVHLFCRTEIAALVANKTPNLIFIKYSDFANIFFLKLILIFFKYIGINDHIIEQIDEWQPLYGSIYNLKLVELEILKTYIKINLANGFIKLFIFLAKTSIFLTKN